MKNNDTSKLAYNVREASKLLGLSLNSMYKAINDGEIPHVRIGSRILIPKSKLDQMLMNT